MPDKHRSAVIFQDFAGLFVALAAIALAAAMLFDYSTKQEAADERMNHSRALYNDSQRLLVDCVRANIAVRDYLSSGNPQYRLIYRDLRQTLLDQTQVLSTTTRTGAIKSAIAEKLSPALQSFLYACDKLEVQAKKQELAGGTDRPALQDGFARLLESVETVRAMQHKVLLDRQQKITTLYQNIEETRVLILLVAFVAILFSCITLRTVMRKDSQKIETLESAFQRIQEAQTTATEALDRARRSDQLKSHFMANISHEIRTPMTGILGMADLLCACDLGPEAEEYAQVMFKSSQDLLSVLDDLLNFSKLERHEYVVEKKSFAIRQTIKDVIGKVKSTARTKELALSTQVDESVPQIICGDEDKIRSVLSALVSNGLKFTSAGGVQIHAHCTADMLVRIAVIDTGIGIEQEEHKTIFQPFFQVDGGIQSNYGGTGLSLTIAKRTVELMQGEIGVISEPGCGSIFWFTFDGGKAND